LWGFAKKACHLAILAHGTLADHISQQTVCWDRRLAKTVCNSGNGVLAARNESTSSVPFLGAREPPLLASMHPTFAV